MTEELLLYFILCVTSLFIIINPFSTLAVFIPLTHGFKKENKREMLFNSSKLGWAILIIFSLSGLLFFQLFSLSIGSFKLAGGILLFSISLIMIFKGNEISSGNPEEIKDEYSKRDDLTVIPLTIPFTSGPGAITTSIVLASQAVSVSHWAILLLSITLAMIMNYFVLINSDLVQKMLKENGIKILTKLMGVIVCSVGIQFIINGIVDLIPFVLSQL
jgi:multiple antibiotic resistance protein